MQQNFFTLEKQVHSVTKSPIQKFQTPQPPIKTIKIQYLKNHELHENLKTLVGEERKTTHEILLHIMEVDRRKLHLGMAYPSLWEYLVTGIGYSAPQAQRRIDAARLMVQVPELGKKLESGVVNLSQISILQKTIRNSQKENKTKYSMEEKKKMVAQIENKSLKETQVILAETFNLPVYVQEIKTPQRDRSVRVEMTFSKEEMDLLNWAQGQLAHGLFKFHPEMNLKNLMLYSVQKVLREKTGLQV